MLLGMLYSCSENFDPATDLNGNSSDILSMLQSEDITQRASIDSDNFVFTSNAGTVVRALPNSFVFDDGNLASGLIDFEMTELYTKSDILRYGIPTMTYRSEILESDGEFLFKASQNGQKLTLATTRALSFFVMNSEPNPEMLLFRPFEGLWRFTDYPINAIGPSPTNSFSGYEAFSTELDWVNIDYFVKFDLELTDIGMCLPDGYKDNSVKLWVVFKELNIVLATDGRNLPIGEDIFVVCIAEDLKVNLEPKRTSEEDIKERLAELD